jgi:signal transduction histidine kinase
LECLRLSDELLADIRGVVDTLRAHDGIDLHAALTALAPALPRPRLRLELAADARVSGLNPAQALLRCTQEGLTNALRHSSAENLVLRLMSTAQGVELQIEDDGRATMVPVFGNGLNGMRERLAALGGGLDIEIVDGGGLRLRARLPAALA